MPSKLEEIIKKEIHAGGPITFERFMELALYHPEHGYYGAGRAVIGKHGDYYTSSHATGAYGQIIAEMAVGLSCSISGTCTFVEMGAGEGFFARDFLEHLRRYHPGNTIEYAIVESSGGMVQKQREALYDFAGEVAWYKSLGEMKAVTGIFFSNELVDAFPFHMVKQEADRLVEVFVTLRNNKLKYEQGPLSNVQISRYFNRLLMRLEPGMTTEVNLNAVDWMREVSEKLKKGYVITVDYGYPAREYYSPERPNGTHLCYYRHQTNENPLENVGEQDITAHVEFTSLAAAGKDNGLQTLLFTSQSPFLIKGASMLEETLAKAGAGPDEMAKAASGITTLIHPELMGSAFMALVQGKDVPEESILDGIRDYSDRV